MLARALALTTLVMFSSSSLAFVAPAFRATARSSAGAKAPGPPRWRLPPPSPLSSLTARMHGYGPAIFGFPAPWPPRAGGPRPSLFFFSSFIPRHGKFFGFTCLS